MDIWACNDAAIIGASIAIKSKRAERRSCMRRTSWFLHACFAERIQLFRIAHGHGSHAATLAHALFSLLIKSALVVLPSGFFAGKIRVEY
jgi:hypothetical protein